MVINEGRTKIGKIIVIDFGGQYTHLIARRVRELNVYSEILPYTASLDKVIAKGVKGIILSGGPCSVYEEDAPLIDVKVLTSGLPVLGICYGHQLIAHLMGGEVTKAPKGEYGRTLMKIHVTDDLFHGLNKVEVVWMSHRDFVSKAPASFEVLASTKYSPVAAMKHRVLPIYGVQFHPEVSHTQHGMVILKNFLFKVCKCEPNWYPEKLIPKIIENIREKVGRSKVICALSGGVDSLTTALLIKRAIGDNLVAVFVDHGLLRKGEKNYVINLLKKLEIKYLAIDACHEFLTELKGVKDPEIKRKIIGAKFIEIFERVAKEVGAEWLAQGTIYPDRVESGRVGVRKSRIKSHHNVGGLPKRVQLKLLEPLSDFYKDEVRKIARELGVPDEVVKRHPFPGPGLAVRIIGEITEDKLRVVREASHIVEEELKAVGLYDRVWQAFAVVGEDKWVGVMGDERKEGYIVTIRIVESADGMTADWVRIPYNVLERISNRITSEVEGVTMVTYAITSKPPSTIEPC